MPAIKIGVRAFHKQTARFLESDTPVAVTRRGETLGFYVSTQRRSVKSADMTELRTAADRLAAALSGRRVQTDASWKKRLPPAKIIVLDVNVLIRAILGKRVRQVREIYARSKAGSGDRVSLIKSQTSPFSMSDLAI